MSRKIYVFLWALIFCLRLSSAQETRQWVSFTYDATERDTYRISTTQHLRWNSRILEQLITEIDFKQKLNTKLDLGIEFRYILERDRQGKIQGNESFGRFRLNIYHDLEVARLDLHQRISIQQRNRWHDGSFQRKFRFRQEFGPKIKKFSYDPILSIEYLRNLELEDNYAVRYGVEIPVKISSSQLELGYFYESHAQGTNESEHVIFLKTKLGNNL